MAPRDGHTGRTGRYLLCGEIGRLCGEIGRLCGEIGRPVRLIGAQRRGDLVGIAWIVCCVGFYLSPAFKDGPSFGPADIGGQLSYLTYIPNLVFHNHLNGDIITQSVAWDRLDWLAVHHGQLPLWNNFSGDGMPLMLNFESAPFSLPELVGYLFPLSASYLVVVAVKLLIAGTGAYLATRLAGARPLGAAMAGTTFMLSGSLTGWSGWSVTGPLIWSGWILAGALLCWRPGRRRAAGVVISALSTAFAVYGGFPETLVLLAIAVGALVLIGGALGVRRHQVGAAGPARFLAGVAAGAALSGPLWLPGLAVLRQSSRFTENATGGIAPRGLALLFAQGYDGLPTAGSTWIGPANYYEATAYVGIIALVLALFTVLVWWRRPIVVALAGTTALCLVIVYGAPTQRLFTSLGGGDIATQRMLPMLAFCTALLAGLGTEALRRHWHERGAQRRLVTSLVVCGGVLVYLLLIADGPGLTRAELSARQHALLWPLATVLGVAVVLALAITSQARARRRSAGTATALVPAVFIPAAFIPAACLVLLAVQSAYLVLAGVGVNSYSSQPYPLDASVTTLQRLVGDSLVALDGPNTQDVTQWTGTGIYPEVNVGYGIRELAIHDPVLPPSYLRTWPVPGATVNDRLGDNVFVPSVGSAKRARFYGASFILASPGRVPKGAVFVARIPAALVKYVSLYRVPGSGSFSFGTGSGARVLTGAQPDNGTWLLTVRVPRTSALTLRVTYLPGWHVLADGRALPVHKVDGLFVGATVPAGTRTIVLRYWPGGLSLGFDLAVAALAMLGLASSAEEVRRRKRRRYSAVRAAGSLGPGPSGAGPSGAGPSGARLSFSLTTKDEPPGGMLTP